MAEKREGIAYAKEQFEEKLEKYVDDLDGSVFEAIGGALGEITLDDGRIAQIQYKITTDEEEFVDD